VSMEGLIPPRVALAPAPQTLTLFFSFPLLCSYRWQTPRSSPTLSDIVRHSNNNKHTLLLI